MSDSQAPHQENGGPLSIVLTGQALIQSDVRQT